MCDFDFALNDNRRVQRKLGGPITTLGQTAAYSPKSAIMMSVNPSITAACPTKRGAEVTMPKTRP